MDSSPTKQARPVWPMNEDQEPISWPSAGPEGLSEDAQTIYRRAESGRPLTQDWLDPKAGRRWISQQEKDSYEPSERVLAAIEELKSVGLASYDSSYLFLNRVSKHYTVAEGRGSQLIRVYLNDSDSMDRVLLAVLVGADLESQDIRSNSMPRIVARARHATATDEEHSAASTALVEISAPTNPVFNFYGEVTFKGFLTGLNLYPLGADPLSWGENDPEDLCDYEAEDHDEHPFADYMPPKVELQPTAKGTIVEIECLPYRPYLVAQD